MRYAVEQGLAFGDQRSRSATPVGPSLSESLHKNHSALQYKQLKNKDIKNGSLNASKFS
jgi:hypothetical protein